MAIGASRSAPPSTRLAPARRTTCAQCWRGFRLGVDADYLSSAGRIAIVGRDFELAQSLFTSALQQDQMA